jgi:hypothetical protein
MPSDGRYAKDAIRQRLAAANTRASSAAKIMDSAHRMLEIARKNFESARENLEYARENFDRSHDEVSSAEALLREADERWVEIEIDDEMSRDASSSKRRKVAAPTSGGIGPSSHGISSSGIGGVPDVSNAAATIRTSNRDNSDIREVVIRGCKKLSGVNGTFKRKSGGATYGKIGCWDGKSVPYKLGRISGAWRIYIDYGSKKLYLYDNQANSDVPPANGWTVVGGGTLPAPSILVKRHQK